MFLSFPCLFLSERVNEDVPLPQYPSQVWAGCQSWSASGGAHPRLCAAPLASRLLQLLFLHPRLAGSDTLHLCPLHCC